MPPQSPPQRTGHRYETLACAHLRRHGLTLLARNYRCRLGEIDLVMRERDCLVFVEVRYRALQRYGGPLASVGSDKQRRLIRTAQHFLLCHPQCARYGCRFDVVAVSRAPTGEVAIDWIRAAFD